MILDILYNDYVRAAVLFTLFIILGKLLHVLVLKYLRKIITRNNHKLDTRILDRLEHPLHALVIVIGAHLALKQINQLAPHKTILTGAFFVLFTLVISLVVSRMAAALIDRWLQVRKKYSHIPELVNKMIAIVIYVIAGLIILSYFSIEITPLIATLGVGGLAVGLALQNTLRDFFAGLHLISDKPINVGHFVELDDKISGYVEDIGWRSTRIRTLPNTVVVVPNSKLAESTIINNSLPTLETAIIIPCGVAYTSNLDKVEKVTIATAKKIQKKVQGAVKDFEPFIRYNAFGESNINFSIILRVEKYVDKYIVTHEFIKALKQAYDKEKIEISWPVRNVHLHK